MNDVSTIFRDLNRLYSDLKKGQTPTSVELQLLKTQLAQLKELDESLGHITSGPFDVFDRKELALQQRAAAWLLGWAAFSRIVLQFSRQNSDPVARQQLLSLNEPSVLSLLLAIYQQLKEANTGIAEPLKHRLNNRLNIASLNYTETILLPDGKRDWYIPSSAELIGKYDDDPAVHHDILSLWALVNLQFDTWHASAPEFEPANCRTRTATVSDGTLGLSPLVSWLDTLVNEVHVPFLDETDGLRIPVSKIVKFLQFRQQFAHAQDLRALCDNIRTQRLQEIPEKPAPLISLIEAASPTANNEQLYDAAIWLRYIVLMSFDRERSVILDDAATNNLKIAWEKFGLGQPFTPVVVSSKVRRSSSCAPFLRWNAPPYNGHGSAVLGDLLEATYNYLSTERKIQTLEEDRFRTISEFDLKASGRNYARKLGEQLNQLDAVFADWIQPYFPPENASEPEAYQPAHWADPSLLTMPGADREVAFRSSSTRSEQERFAGDLATLATEIKSTQAKYGLIQRAYDQVNGANEDPQEILNTLESLGGLTALSNWNLYRLPSDSFDTLKQKLKDAITEWKIAVDAAVLKDQLRSSSTIKRKDVERDYLTLFAARSGKRVAERAIKISQIYENIHVLGVRIAVLEAQASRLEQEGWKSESERAGAELAYRRRIRDLAAARVEALIEASKEASELAKTAEEELGAMAEQLQAAARTIEDNRSSSAIFGIVKLVVNVVGAVLAPFTGGASIAIATLVNKGLDIYQQIERMKWGGLTETIANLEQLAPAIAEGISFAVDKFGTPKMKEEFAQVSMFLKSTQEKLRNVFEDLKKAGRDIEKGDTVQSIIKAVQNFKKDIDVLNFATAIANGYIVTVAGTQINLDFHGKQVRLTNQQLQKDLLDLFG